MSKDAAWGMSHLCDPPHLYAHIYKKGIPELGNESKCLKAENKSSVVNC